MAIGEPLVALRGVGKSFDNGATALRGFDLEVREGEFLSLLGPSGCGKSTALRLIAGLSAPSAGELTWRKGQKREAGFVFQEPTLMPWARVQENVYLPLRLAGASRRDAQGAIADALSLVGLTGFERAFPRELSGGMKMRVSIARALALRPALLLMDEPFAALDEITRFRLNNDLQRVRQETGATIVFVTHSVYESVYLSSRIAVVSSRPGRVIADIGVEAPSPRGEAFRLTHEYARACQDASAALHEAMRDEFSGDAA